MISRKTNQQQETQQPERKVFDCKVTRVRETSKGAIFFDMEVNGVTIYGCSYRELERKDGSGSFAKIGFPSKKGKDDKYYNEAYFPVSDDDIASIEKQIEALI